MSIILASASQTRKNLLRQAHIDFIATGHTFNERSITDFYVQNPVKLTQLLATKKVQHTIIPQDTLNNTIIIAADTIVYHEPNTIFHKPTSYQDAVETLQELRTEPILVATTLAIGKYRANTQSIACINHVTTITKIILQISDTAIQTYLQNHQDIYPYVAGGLIVENFGAQYIQSIEGSYTGALGLPMTELHVLMKKDNQID